MKREKNSLPRWIGLKVFLLGLLLALAGLILAFNGLQGLANKLAYSGIATSIIGLLIHFGEFMAYRNRKEED
jgi:hypothetical protein